MRILVLKKSRLLLLTFTITLLLFSTGGSARLGNDHSLDQSRRSDAARALPQKIDADAELKRALGSTDVATVTFELQDEPVAVHQTKAAAAVAEGTDRRQLLESPEALAYESILATQQEN